jgi:ABC-type histidine transport system ATPase subunit
MERFEFQPLTARDITDVIRVPVTLIEDGDSIIVETPALTATKRVDLRNLFALRGFIEQPGGPPKNSLVQRTASRMARIISR